MSLFDEFDHTAAPVLTNYPFVERAGLKVVHAERGRAVMYLPFEPNINHVNMVYAGALFTVAEVPGGVLFGSAFDLTKYYPVVGEMSIRFRSPAWGAVMVDARMTDDEIARVDADLAAKGRAKWVLDQEVVDEKGTVVATTSATYFGMAY